MIKTPGKSAQEDASPRHLHVICFDIPFPANYGGVIDVFYRIRALYRAGVKVHLHTYQYGGRGHSPELEAICHEVRYYKRRMLRDPFFSKLPYIVNTRDSSELLENLLLDTHPILFEGIHTCYHLNSPELQGRIRIVRMHNIEHIYYRNLAKIEGNPIKRYFFRKEAARLKAFESQLACASAIAAISPDDVKYLSLRYKNVFYLPVFHAQDEMQPGSGDVPMAVYHGNLGVGENNEAALFLADKVFRGLNYKLIITGNNPSRELQELCSGLDNVVLKSHVTTEEINSLVRSAKINLLPTFQSTGMKLKLINVLFQAGHVIVNSKMVRNTGMEALCEVANTAKEMQKAVLRLGNSEFRVEMLTRRRAFLMSTFSNEENAQALIQQIHALETCGSILAEPDQFVSAKKLAPSKLARARS